MPRRLTRAVALAASLGLSMPGWASELCTEDAMIVFDGSGSMAETGFNQIGKPRIFEARRAVREAVPGIAEARRLGLVIYGPGRAGEPGISCKSVDIRFGPQWQAAAPIIDAVDGLAPAGDTPLTAAIATAADVLDYRDRPGAIVLVTDGKETCGGTPCLLAAELAADAADLTVHVIGYKVRGDFFSWESQNNQYEDAETVARCLADRTGGKYVSAETVSELVAALRVTLGCNVYGASASAGMHRPG
ncbi:von Willebrand factor type A domain protein [Roseivivax sp. THAF40]|uniref:vWA domain-containing protein n=1 Tax=unclassified Roseivivax TaxID=2639302 RepID=UPI0012AA0CD3|nr:MULTISPECIES: VWA domain-containing protein [unclassified Roseivivax]QFS84211.1 von Willebrand factor type A domain protein [Roseivivax sp. THAF197b]QFT48039.1 von Willebrand factor type A domain protein [Roseivivax sp. THAF40]